MMSPQTVSRRAWLMLVLLILFSIISYVERTNLSVASKFIDDEYGLGADFIGIMLGAFLVSYTIAQVPAGVLIDRFGAYAVLGWSAVLWGVVTIAIAVAGSVGLPALQVGVTLVVLRIVLGAVEAPTYPAINKAIAATFPEAKRSTPIALIQAAGYAGSAIALPLMAWAASEWGWRAAVLVSAVPALLLSAAWFVLARGAIGKVPGDRPRPAPVSAGSWRDVAANRNVHLISLSYFAHGYSSYIFFFWFYTYLVEERGFGLATGGLIAAFPALMGAVGALIGGSADRAVALRWGTLAGRRGLILFGNVIGAASLLAGAFSPYPAIAIGGFAVSLFARGLVETPHWSLLINAAGDKVGTAGGIMNTYVNLGGAISTAIAGLLIAAVGWAGMFGIAAAIVLVGSLQLFLLRSPQIRNDPKIDR